MICIECFRSYAFIPLVCAHIVVIGMKKESKMKQARRCLKLPIRTVHWATSRTNATVVCTSRQCKCVMSSPNGGLGLIRTGVALLQCSESSLDLSPSRIKAKSCSRTGLANRTGRAGDSVGRFMLCMSCRVKASYAQPVRGTGQ